jgi:Putative addiction module component
MQKLLNLELKMAFILPLDSMSIAEKIQVMEVLWEDLSKYNSNIEAPSWHQDILKQREQAIENGQSHFLDWNEAKKQILNNIS